MKISKDNYEAFFLDYHEGNLSEKLKKDVLAFVDANPDLKEEFQSFEIISLTEKPVRFSGKEKLKKNAITGFNYKTWFVAYEENDLDEKDKKQVEQFIEINPAYKPELEIVKQAKIHPDYSIRFANKSSLKRGGAVIPLWVRLAAAACLVIGLLSYWMIQQKPKREFVVDHKAQISPPVQSDKKSVKEEVITGAEVNKEVAENKHLHKKVQKPAMKKSVDPKAEENLAGNDSFPSSHQPLALQPETSNVNPQTTIIINENNNQRVKPVEKLVVLDDNDLAELGLKEQKETENKSLLADAVNGVGKIFGVNAHYGKEHNLLQAKYRETLALGPLAVTRTVLR